MRSDLTLCVGMSLSIKSLSMTSFQEIQRGLVNKEVGSAGMSLVSR